jgi:transposase
MIAYTIAEIFGIHESFIYKLLRQRRERGNIAPLPHGGGAQPKLTETHAQTLAGLSAAHPDATLAELSELLREEERYPVECISKIKETLRSLKARTQRKLYHALKKAMALVTGDDIRGWFEHCGYIYSCN